MVSETWVVTCIGLTIKSRSRPRDAVQVASLGGACAKAKSLGGKKVKLGGRDLSERGRKERDRADLNLLQRGNQIGAHFNTRQTLVADKPTPEKGKGCRNGEPKRALQTRLSCDVASRKKKKNRKQALRRW